ncbi:hypothetical protein CK203_109048 [Vitis vinifera]|uniref:Reverse transcriptase/retrotransposon-derived protein RNase H-like domain-containing protein n=1 Tax=Vitis vinifera TaxID=29760 RepID=A0A438C5L8_VITVI|nr:hypothetical protein CK203_109048 [Vitis vinifera]
MLKKDSFEWSGQAEEAFQKLKLAMTNAPVLALPNFNRIFVVECDAIGFGIDYMGYHDPLFAIETQHSLAPSGENCLVFKEQLSTSALAIIPKQMGKLK